MNKWKKAKKVFSFDHENHDKDNRISAYYPYGGILQTIDGGMHFLDEEEKELLNKYLEEFFNKAWFKVKQK